MPDIAKVLKEEIQRLARKEIRAATANLRKDTIALKRAVNEQKRRIDALERQNKKLHAGAAKPKGEKQDAESPVVNARISAKMIKSIRKRLGLSQAQLAKLLGVNGQTVYQWEHKEGRLTFRRNIKERIVEIRNLGAREAKKLLG